MISNTSGGPQIPCWTAYEQIVKGKENTMNSKTDKLPDFEKALEELGWADQVAFIKNNVDLETNATFGCHENYLVSRAFQFDNRENLRLLASFLVTRQIYAGTGRTGACNPQPFRDWDQSGADYDRQ